MTSLLSGYLDRTGALVIPTTLRDARPFHGELALAKPFGGWCFGVLDFDGKWLVEPLLAAYSEWSENIASFNLGGNFDDDGDVVGGAWGVVGDGRVLITPRLEDVGGCVQGRIPFKQAGQWGYFDRHGGVLVRPRFEEADDYTADGLAVVTERGRDGYIDLNGELRLGVHFDSLAPCSEGRGRARLADTWHVIDLDGQVLSEGFDEILPFHGGMARVIRNDEVGYVNLHGQLIGSDWFDEAATYGDGLAPVRRDDEWFVLDLRGVLHGPYDRALPPSEGLARFVDADGALGFLAADGTVRITPRYQAALGFRDGLAAVQRDGLWTFVDTTGAELHTPYWHRAASFADGLATVRFGTRAGCVDRTGKIAIPLDFDVIAPFSSGRAAVKKIQWRQLGPTPSWHVTPPGGLSFPGFAGADADDELRISVCFSRDVKDDDSLRLQQVVDMWRAVADAHAGGAAIRDHWISDYALSLRVGDVPYPVELATVLLEELRTLELPIQDVALGRFRDSDDQALHRPYALSESSSRRVGWAAVPDPDDPRGSDQFPTFDDYARQAFEGTPPPASESAQQVLAGRWDGRSEKVVYAERTFTLHLPDIRICFGVTQDGFVPIDDRARQVSDSLTHQLALAFDRRRMWFYPPNKDPGPPRPFTRGTQPGVEPLQLDLAGRSRRGYCFAIDSITVLQDIGPGQYRFRENELMEAIAGTVRALGLAPVIMWQRFGNPLPGPSYPGWAHPMQPTVYVMNLWEP